MIYEMKAQIDLPFKYKKNEIDFLILTPDP